MFLLLEHAQTEPGQHLTSLHIFNGLFTPCSKLAKMTLTCKHSPAPHSAQNTTHKVSDWIPNSFSLQLERTCCFPATQTPGTTASYSWRQYQVGSSKVDNKYTVQCLFRALEDAAINTSSNPEVSAVSHAQDPQTAQWKHHEYPTETDVWNNRGNVGMHSFQQELCALLRELIQLTEGTSAQPN